MLPVARLHGSRGDEFALVSVVKGWQVRQGFIFVTVNGEPDNSNLSVSCAIRAGEVWVGSELRVLRSDSGLQTSAVVMWKEMSQEQNMHATGLLATG